MSTFGKDYDRCYIVECNRPIRRRPSGRWQHLDIDELLRHDALPKRVYGEQREETAE